jgi:hypothetical protein
MAVLGMHGGAAARGPAAGRRQLIYSRAHRVNPRVGGLLRSRCGTDRLATPVTTGELLGEVVSPYTFKVVEQLHAPVDGLLFYVARDYPVHPGDWAFGVAETGRDAEWVVNP